MKIHIIEPLGIDQAKQESMKRELSAEGHELVFISDRNQDVQEIIRRGTGAEVVVIGNLPFPAEVVQSLPDLKLLAVAFTGLDHVAMEACREKDITVCNASGYSTISVAELTIGLIIDVLRNMTRLDPLTRKGGTRDGLVGFDLCGKTVGIIGLGAIGQYVARLLSAFNCRILGLDRGKAMPGDLKIELTDMKTLLESSDIVTLHCPLNESTKDLIGPEELALMKSSAILINCARGPVVNAIALENALKTGRIAGAGLDVFATEPPLDKEIEQVLKLENVVVTPHIAFATKEAFLRRADIVVDNILSWAAGNPKNVK